MITVTDKKKCCGCGGCYQVCPKGAIELTSDAEGFHYPKVDRAKCVGCGLCDRVCPVLNAPKPSDDVAVCVHVALAEDTDLRMASSSGGIFTVLAEAVNAQGGEVYGAAFAPDFSVHHRAVQTREDLAALRGSKYVQSDMDVCYRQAKSSLDAGRQVLFSGTACQIAGLHRFLGREYDNLLTVDVLCHGVPSPKAWQAYIRRAQQRQGAKLVSANFRSKDTGWMRFAMKMEFADGKAECTPFPEDAYMQAFLRNYSLRPSCYACRFKGMNRPSDITLGDCWDIRQVDETMHDDRGTSVIIVRTEKGQRALDCVKGLRMKRAELDKALPPAADSRRSVVAHPRRAAFFRSLTEEEFPVIKADTAWDRRRILLVKIWRKFLRTLNR